LCNTKEKGVVGYLYISGMKKYWRIGPVECEVDGVMSEHLAAALEQLLSSYPQLSLKLDSLRPPLNRYCTDIAIGCVAANFP
jgi:hypothetical protein